jgi:tetratricopeptide (TPR) repeat protein
MSAARAFAAAAAALLLVGCGGEAAATVGAGEPTFAEHIAPIVYRACTPCHHEGGPTPFALRGYDDVVRRRRKIAEVTALGLMPPWLPSHPEFDGDRRLAAAELALLQAWCEGDAPRGDPAREPTAPTFAAGWQLGEPDLVLRPEVAFELPAAGADEVRNLVIPAGIGSARFVAAVEIRPHSPAVHHAVLAVDGSGRARQLDAADPAPGFVAMDLGGARPPDGYFVGWTPGKAARRFGDGMAWQLQPGHDLVLQLHLVPTGRRETVAPEIGIHFTALAPTVVTYPLTLFAADIDLPPGVRDVRVGDRFVLPVAVTVHSIYPHAHYLCTSMGAWATTPGGARQDLLTLPRWDFDWQDDYRYRTPVALPAGTELAFEYTFDNSADNPANPSRPPQHVRSGDRSIDEMANLTLQVVVADHAGRRRLGEASLQHELRQLGEAPSLLVQLAALWRDEGRFAEGLAAAERALRASPGHAAAQFERALGLQRLGRAVEAEAALRACLATEPGHFEARVQLGSLLLGTSRAAEAQAAFEAALALRPDSAAVLTNLGLALLAGNDLAGAEVRLRAALTHDRDQFAAWFYLGELLRATGRAEEAKAAYRSALRLRPGEARATAALAALGG